ncbi:MAG: phosphoesterase, partial [Gammaproteobacteria bacterium]|nr:phosphoesterase [Gammaproteobacteria bacterium]
MPYHRAAWLLTPFLLLLSSCETPPDVGDYKESDTRSWLAGDHHIHSRYSVEWDMETDPPTPLIGGDAIYPIPMNAVMGKYFGLSWMVATDHGGPNHSKVNLERAYPELVQSRLVVAEVIQFYGMELDTPAGEHSSLIIPHTHDEAKVLHQLEADFDTVEKFPVDPLRDTEAKMIEALEVMRDLDAPPIVIANHPARTATGDGIYGAYHPAELRRWNDTPPDVAIGMAGAPGHQALALTTNP